MRNLKGFQFNGVTKGMPSGKQGRMFFFHKVVKLLHIYLRIHTAIHSARDLQSSYFFCKALFGGWRRAFDSVV